MKDIYGDIFDYLDEFDVIVHGCNCFNSMGAGIAKTVKKRFPEAYAADLKTIKGDKSKLGRITYATVEYDDRELVIVNAYTQYKYWLKGVVMADNQAIKKAFRRIKKKFTGKRIGIPKIGAGLAGGDWDEIRKIIDEVMQDEDVTVVIYD